MKKILLLILTFFAFNAICAPKFTDYCEMLSRDIEGKQYSLQNSL